MSMRRASTGHRGRAANSCFVPARGNRRLTNPYGGGIISFALRRYLSWIEGLTTNQNVTGSNPVRRTSRTLRCSAGHLFCWEPLRGFEPVGVARLSKRASVCQRACEGAEAPEAADAAGGRESCTPHQSNFKVLLGAPFLFRSPCGDSNLAGGASPLVP